MSMRSSFESASESSPYSSTVPPWPPGPLKLANGLENHCSKLSTELKIVGSRKLSSAHSSGSEFCSGVPVSSTRRFDEERKGRVLWAGNPQGVDDLGSHLQGREVRRVPPRHWSVESMLESISRLLELLTELVVVGFIRDEVIDNFPAEMTVVFRADFRDALRNLRPYLGVAAHRLTTKFQNSSTGSAVLAERRN